MSFVQVEILCVEVLIIWITRQEPTINRLVIFCFMNLVSPIPLVTASEPAQERPRRARHLKASSPGRLSAFARILPRNRRMSLSRCWDEGQPNRLFGARQQAPEICQDSKNHVGTVQR